MPDADTVHVWSIEAARRPSPIAELAALLDDEERRRAGILQDADARRRFLTMHGAVRVIVGEHLGAPPEQIRWRRGPHGKPELAGAWTGAQVNLSHSGDLAVLALTDRRPVGVDVQESPPGSDAVRLAARFFPAAESRFVAAGQPDQQADRFARLWVRKEACVKAAWVRLVQGLPLPVRGDDDVVVTVAADRYLVRDLAAPPGCRAAVALAGTGAFRVVRHSWPP